MRNISLALSLSLLVACGAGDADKDGFDASVDCDDENENVHPDAIEVCDGVDNNCDGFTDDATAEDAPTWYGDADGDTFGGDIITIVTCDQPEGFVAEATDCDDLNEAINPNGSEICDGLDNDCDELVDSADDSVDMETATTWYIDGDEDGYGTADSTVDQCDQPDGYVLADGDCDDEDPTLNPETVWYADIDGDGHGATDFVTVQCEQPDNHTATAGDCADLDPLVNPDAQEICDGQDNDCDDLTDDADDSVDPATYTVWYADTDTDTFGDATLTHSSCAVPAGYVADDTDCDDGDIDVNPDAEEICDDSIDNDCTGDAPECGPQSGDTSGADYVITGNSNSDYLGRGMAMADVDGDGYADLIIGAYSDDDNGSGSGTVSVVSTTLTADIDASSADANWTGATSYDSMGYQVANAGDIDGDGYDDVLMGAYGGDGGGNSSSGYVYLVMGSSTAHSDGDIDDIYDAQWTGAARYDYLGHSVAGYGDLDDDGYDDFGMGAYGADNNGSTSGSIYITYGASTGPSGEYSSNDADAIISGASSSSYVGYLGSHTAGDFDGDGYKDMLVGSYYGASYYGAAYIYYGSSTQMSGSYTADDADADFEGANTFDYFGQRVAAGDLDGDGYDDAVIAEEAGASDLGAVWIYLGSSTDMSGSYETTDADIAMEGEATYDDFGGSLVIGDLNGDGDLDLVVGSDQYDDSTTYSVGAAYVFYGGLQSSTYTAGTDEDVKLAGTASYEYLSGYSMAMGDHDGDGVDDLMVASAGASSYAGEVYMFFGGGM